MNIEAYISSGILEAYVLGDLTERERADVETMAAQHPEVRAALREIEETQEQLLMRTAVQPRAHVKERLMASIQGQRQPEGKVTQMAPALRVWQWVAAASVVIGLVSSYLAYNYHEKWQDTASRMNDLIAQNQRMAQDYNQVNENLERIEGDLQVIENPAFVRVTMTGTDNAPDAQASVYWNPQTQEVYLRVQQLKALARENQYQLWAIVDGKPVDAGVFDGGGTNTLLAMKSISGAAAFAVTVEPRGGKQSPTLETMQVIGQLQKG